jgi:hypothetical protein
MIGLRAALIKTWALPSECVLAVQIEKDKFDDAHGEFQGKARVARDSFQLLNANCFQCLVTVNRIAIDVIDYWCDKSDGPVPTNPPNIRAHARGSAALLSCMVSGSWPTPCHPQCLIRSELGQSYTIDAPLL